MFSTPKGRKVRKLEKPDNQLPNVSSPNTDYFAPILQIRQNSQKELREQVRQLQKDLEENHQSCYDPEELLPQEIWVMILKNLNNINDLANCAQSFGFFSNIINSTPQELLFGKVLPQLFPHFDEEIATTVVTCGKVCRKWRTAVDCFAESFYSLNQPITTSMAALVKDPKPSFQNKYKLNGEPHIIPMEQERLGYVEHFEENMRKTAFLSAAKYGLITQTYGERLTTLTALDNYGHLLWQLTLLLNIMYGYTTKQLYSWCVKAFNDCRNLKELKMIDWNIDKAFNGVLDNGVDAELELNPVSKLESLSILVVRREILTVQDELLRHLSGQLKQVELRHWNCQTYHNLPWMNLIDLETLEESSTQVLASLEQMVAPQLHKLSLRLDSSSDVLHLFKVVNKFESLRHLAVVLTDGFNVDLSSVPVELLAVNRISILEITSERLNQAQDLPLLFPFIRKLECHYGNRAAKIRKALQDHDGLPEKSRRRKQKLPSSFIQFRKNMYRSNIWALLPLLRNLTLERINENLETKQGRMIGLLVEKQTFTRQMLAWNRKKEHLSNYAKRRLKHALQIIRRKAMDRRNKKPENKATD